MEVNLTTAPIDFENRDPVPPPDSVLEVIENGNRIHELLTARAEVDLFTRTIQDSTVWAQNVSLLISLDRDTNDFEYTLYTENGNMKLRTHAATGHQTGVISLLPAGPDPSDYLVRAYKVNLGEMRMSNSLEHNLKMEFQIQPAYTDENNQELEEFVE